jgi:alpha,alpha-trehalase
MAGGSRHSRVFWLLLSAAILLLATPANRAFTVPPPPPAVSSNSFQSLDDILHYISDDWTGLKRSLTNCNTYQDVKTKGQPTLYLPADVSTSPALAQMQQRCRVQVKHLPANLSEEDAGKIQPHGLLYLENPYVVPGGQFNEMYGWDSYFIIRGLLRDNHRDVAKGMVENFFYEIQHYGGVLNANRTYYLGRSQPPFLSSMILAVYEADRAAGHADLQWLARAYQFAVKDYDQWTKAPHLAGDTGLSRYFDNGDGPVPEIVGDPANYYRGVAQFFLNHEGEKSSHLVMVGAKQPQPAAFPPVFNIQFCPAGAAKNQNAGCDQDRVELTADFYKGDRSMRESGFDVSFRFGPYGADTHRLAPVCLNSLLYKTEKDLEQISTLLGHADEAREWANRAAQRRERIFKYLWDQRRGMFFDYNFATGTRSTYDYATTFYPLWAGLASDDQARAVDANLHLFEQPGGLAMSTHESGAQWDYPYGWAPIHLLAVEGLRSYKFNADADRISFKFLTTVLKNFRNEHTIREKYNVVSQSAVTHVVVGYHQNVIGFGWTNGTFLELLHESPGLAARLKEE